MAGVTAGRRAQRAADTGRWAALGRLAFGRVRRAGVRWALRRPVSATAVFVADLAEKADDPAVEAVRLAAGSSGR